MYLKICLTSIQVFSVDEARDGRGLALRGLDSTLRWPHTHPPPARRTAQAKIDDEAPLEQNYEILGTAIERALAKLQLAAEQLRAAKATLDGSIELLGEVESSEEAEADCNVDLMVAQMMSSRALSNLWSASEPLNEALGFEDAEEEDDEGDIG
jgi:hypothetical protein